MNEKLTEIQNTLTEKEELSLSSVIAYIVVHIESQEGTFQVFYDWTSGEYYNINYLNGREEIKIHKNEYPELYDHLIYVAETIGIEDPDAVSTLVKE
jgi:hypothetical protein